MWGGSQVGSSEATPATYTNPAVPAIIGAYQNQVQNFSNGHMDDLRVYNRVLSGAEIATLAAGATPEATDLELHLKFDEGTGTNATDSSGNGNDGTLTNGPTWSTDIPAALVITANSAAMLMGL